MIVDPKGRPAKAGNGKSELVTAESPFAVIHRAAMGLASAQTKREKQARLRAILTHLAGFERAFLGVSTALGEAHRALVEATGGEIFTVRIDARKLPPGTSWRIVDEEGTPCVVVDSQNGKILREPKHVGALLCEIKLPDGTVRRIAPPSSEASPVDEATRPTEPAPPDDQACGHCAGEGVVGDRQRCDFCDGSGREPRDEEADLEEELDRRAEEDLEA